MHIFVSVCAAMHVQNLILYIEKSVQKKPCVITPLCLLKGESNQLPFPHKQNNKHTK